MVVLVRRFARAVAVRALLERGSCTLVRRGKLGDSVLLSVQECRSTPSARFGLVRQREVLTFIWPVKDVDLCSVLPANCPEASGWSASIVGWRSVPFVFGLNGWSLAAVERIRTVVGQRDLVELEIDLVVGPSEHGGLPPEGASPVGSGQTHSVVRWVDAGMLREEAYGSVELGVDALGVGKSDVALGRRSVRWLEGQDPAQLVSIQGVLPHAGVASLGVRVTHRGDSLCPRRLRRLDRSLRRVRQVLVACCYSGLLGLDFVEDGWNLRLLTWALLYSSDGNV